MAYNLDNLWADVAASSPEKVWLGTICQAILAVAIELRGLRREVHAIHTSAYFARKEQQFEKGGSGEDLAEVGPDRGTAWVEGSW